MIYQVRLVFIEVPKEKMVFFGVNLGVAVRKGAELVVIEEGPEPNLRRCVIKHLARLGSDIDGSIPCEDALEDGTLLGRGRRQIGLRVAQRRGNLGRGDHGIMRP